MTVIHLKSHKWNLVAGIVMLLLGVFVLFNPLGTMLALAFYIGLGFVLAGGLYVLSAIDIKSGWYLLVGLFDILVGLIFMANLGVTAATLPIILALWSLTVGIIQLVGAFDLRKFGLPWSWSLMMGLLGVGFGLLILVYPTLGAVAISTAVGLYALIFGALQLAEYYVSRHSYQIIIDGK
jgi:uncharacterized membrane protein HdeD (DUF308 family)